MYQYVLLIFFRLLLCMNMRTVKQFKFNFSCMLSQIYKNNSYWNIFDWHSRFTQNSRVKNITKEIKWTLDSVILSKFCGNLNCCGKIVCTILTNIKIKFNISMMGKIKFNISKRGKISWLIQNKMKLTFSIRRNKCFYSLVL